MKIALCMSGHARTYEKTYLFWKKHLMAYHDVDVFVHMWESKGTKINPIPGLDLSTPGVELDSDIDMEKLFKLWRPTRLAYEKYSTMHQKFINDISSLLDAVKKFDFPNNQLYMPLSARSMMYKRISCNEMKNHYERVTGKKYDVVVQTRFDVAPVRPLPENIFTDLNWLYLNDTRNLTMLEPDLSINDYAAVGSSCYINKWCSFFNFYSEALEIPINEPGQLELMLNHHILYRNFLQLEECPFLQTKLGTVILREDETAEGLTQDVDEIKSQIEDMKRRGEWSI